MPNVTTHRAAILLAAVVVGACAAPAPTSPVGQSAAATVPAASTSGTPGVIASPTNAPATSPRITKPVVDLVMSGTVAVVAKGQGGQCIIGRDSSGGNSFGWAGREADFPGLGDSLTLEEPPGTDDIDAKWAIRQGLAFFGTLTTGYTFSDDHKSISIDVDFPPSGTATEHIKGSITCP